MPRPARRPLLATLLVIACSALLAVGGAAIAAPASDVPVVVAPEDGAFLEAGTIVLEWAAVDAPEGYEVTWAAAEGGSTGTTATAATSTAIEVESGSYVWQVRVLPAGEWSAPVSFHADPQLETLAVDEQEPAAAPAPATPRPGIESVPGSVWIGGALGFSAVFLVVVVIQSRLRREQDA